MKTNNLTLTSKTLEALSGFYTVDNLNYLLDNIDDIEGALVSDEMCNEEGYAEIFGGVQRVMGIQNALRKIKKHLTLMKEEMTEANGRKEEGV